jgi:transposase-like protein
MIPCPGIPDQRSGSQSALYGSAVVAIIREADREPMSAVAKRRGISEQTIYTWRKRFAARQ